MKIISVLSHRLQTEFGLLPRRRRGLHDVENPRGRGAQADARLHLLLGGRARLRGRPRDALGRRTRRGEAAQRRLRLRPPLPRRGPQAEEEGRAKGH